MIEVATRITVEALWERCENKSEIPRQIGHGRKTIARGL